MVGRIREAAPSGVDMYMDTFARNDLTTAVDLLARRGRIVLLSGLETCPTLPVGRLYVKDCSSAVRCVRLRCTRCR
ncbi:hypothetical protein ACX6XY_26020 [Streptomyces sp. O3]